MLSSVEILLFRRQNRACSCAHCLPARAPHRARARMSPAGCNPLLLPPRDLARARPLLPRSGPHSAHARAPSYPACTAHMSCCTAARRPHTVPCESSAPPTRSPAGFRCRRPRASKSGRLAAAPLRRFAHIAQGAGCGQGDPYGRCGCGQRPAGDVPRWVGAGGGGGASVGGLWARSGRDRRSTPVQLDELQ